MRARDFRVFVRGKPTSVRLNGASLPAGTTRIPVQDCSYFDSSGKVWLVVERGAYSSRFTALDGNGKTTASKVVGPLQSPGTLSATADNYRAGGLSGAYTYKTTFLSDLGESEPSSASSSVSVTGVPASITGPTLSGAGSGSNYYYGYTYVTDGGETALSPVSGPQTSGGLPANPITVSNIQGSNDPRVKRRRIYRSTATSGAGALFFVAEIDNVGTATYVDSMVDANLGGAAPPSTQTTGGRMALSSIPTGAGGTLTRKVYRTTGGGSTHLYVMTIGDNSTTTAIDDKNDTGLGAAAPSSSLVTTVGGSTSLRVRDTAQFTTAGWVDLGGQLISYTGRSASSGEANLTGVPATGVGAIAADISAGSVVNAVPHITLSSGTTYAVNDGDSMRPYVQRDDTTAQAVVAAVEGGDGIHEFVITEDAVTTIAQMNAIGDADLALFAYPVVTVTYQTRDPKTKAGKSVVINRTSQGYSGTFTIQSVHITEIGIARGLLPLYTVTASSVNLTLEDILVRVLRTVA